MEKQGLFTETIHEKLLEIQKEALRISKDQTNPHFKNKYFDINKMLELLKPKLSDLKVLIVQPTEVSPEGYCIQYTRLIDIETGSMTQSGLRLPDEQNPQKMGGAVTYYRRYTLQNLLALEAEDDDGNMASGIVKKDPVNTAEPMMTDEQESKIKDLIFTASGLDHDTELSLVEKMRNKQLTKNRADEAIEFLETLQKN